MENGSTDKSLLDLQSITMIYPGTIALNQVNLDVKAGECHGIIGKNGAGKTTLMNIISGIIRPSEGQIFINGRQMRFFSRIKSRDEGIFIITQEPQIIPEFTVAENLFYPNYIKKSVGKIDWNSISNQAEQTVQKAGLNLNIEAKANDLSISEQQLLLILKAFFYQ
jgi:ABC-type sugar transport system ATPase subunit